MSKGATGHVNDTDHGAMLGSIGGGDMSELAGVGGGAGWAGATL